MLSDEADAGSAINKRSEMIKQVLSLFFTIVPCVCPDIFYAAEHIEEDNQEYGNVFNRNFPIKWLIITAKIAPVVKIISTKQVHYSPGYSYPIPPRFNKITAG
ncbi:MAG: hypothetical protein KA369_18970 [Spirochaetes bacterium]|nr:hypothetical protein [Spirochaetota bacterium]